MRGHGGVKGGVVQAVSDVSFDVRPGETLGVVGETGSGKSTLARSVLQAPRPKSGSVRFQGNDLVGLKGRRLLEARRSLQMVFQDPFGSLDPKWRVSEIVEEPLVAYGVGTREERRAARARGARHGRPGPRRLRPAPAAPALGRPGPARGHRPRAHARPGADHLRRGRVVARRAHPGPGPQPLRAPARRARALLPVHRPRPRAGQAGLRPRRGHVPRPARASSARPRRSTASRSTPTRSRCWPRSPAPTPTRRATAAHAAISGDPPVADRPAQRLPLPHALPARAGALRGARCRRCASSPPTTPSPATSRSSATAPGRRDGHAPGLPHRRPGDQEPAARRAARPAGRAPARARRLRPRDVGLLARQARRRRRDPRRRRPRRAPARPRAPSSAPSRPSTRPSATTRAARARRGWGSSRPRARRGASSSASSPGATGGS